MTPEQIQALIDYLTKLAEPSVQQFVHTMQQQCAYDFSWNIMWCILGVAGVILSFPVCRYIWSDNCDCDKSSAEAITSVVIFFALVCVVVFINNFGPLVNWIVNPDYMVYQKIIQFSKGLK